MSDRLQKNVARVERRLQAARALGAWPWCATVSFALAALWIVVDKFFPLGVAWSTVLGAATGMSLIAALVWTWVRREDATAAAIELDRRCRLDERVSTALALSKSKIDDRAAAAVRADAERALERVDVRSAFPVSLSRRWAWPLVPLAAAWAATHLAEPGPTPVEASATAKSTAQIRESTADLERKLAAPRREAERLLLAEAQKLLEQLQEEARRLRDADKIEAREALLKLNDLGQKLADRREQVAGAKELQRQLSGLKAKETGPADKFAKAMTQGDYRKAAAELQQLRRELQSEKLSEEQKAKLTKQLDELQKQVEGLAKQQEQRNQGLEQQLAERRSQPGGDPQPDDPQNGEPKSGQPKEPGESNGPDAAELSKKLADATEQSERLKKLQQSLADAAQQLQQGDSKAAQKSLRQLQDQFDELGEQLDEMRLLDQGLLDLAEAKTEMSGEGGDGQEPGQGKSQKLAQNGQGKEGTEGNQQGGTLAGNGPGIGNQPGNRPENPTIEDDKDLFDSRVRAESKPSELRVIGPTDGPNSKGKALAAIRAQTESVAEQGPAPTLDRQPLDRSRRDQKRQYFDALRKAE